MRRYLLDTGILVHYARQSPLYQLIETNEGLSKPDCIPMISVVTQAEIFSFAIQKIWGAKKIEHIQNLLTKIIIIDINSGDTSLIKAYAEIDTYSKGKLTGNPISSSAIKMGKNDLWIASTAKVANATLLTIDGDFDHLNNTYIKVIKYNQQ